MYERSIVKQLDGCGCFDNGVGIAAKQAACQYREYGAYLLAFGFQKLSNDVFHQRVIAAQRLTDYSVQFGQFASQVLSYFFKFRHCDIYLSQN